MESRTTTRYAALCVFFMSISSKNLSAQCDTIQYAEESKSGKEYTGVQSNLNIGPPVGFVLPPLKPISLSPQTSPPLFCVTPLTPPPNVNGPGPKKSPPKFQPDPTLIPPPSPSPKYERPKFAVWCVAKPTVPGPMLQEAMDYACGTGADCGPIQPNGLCFQPNTVLAHASYAFNSYFQRAKRAGGTCDFGGTAILVTDDPSFDRCTFLFT